MSSRRASYTDEFVVDDYEVQNQPKSSPLHQTWCRPLNQQLHAYRFFFPTRQTTHAQSSHSVRPVGFFTLHILTMRGRCCPLLRRWVIILNAFHFSIYPAFGSFSTSICGRLYFLIRVCVGISAYGL